MSDKVIVIPLGATGTLELPEAVYREHLVVPSADGPGAGRGGSPDEPMLDAETLAKQLDIPPSWLERNALTGEIPSYQFGRWRRFKRSEVEATVRQLRA